MDTAGFVENMFKEISGRGVPNIQWVNPAVLTNPGVGHIEFESSVSSRTIDLTGNEGTSVPSDANGTAAGEEQTPFLLTDLVNLEESDDEVEEAAKEASAPEMIDITMQDAEDVESSGEEDEEEDETVDDGGAVDEEEDEEGGEEEEEEEEDGDEEDDREEEEEEDEDGDEDMETSVQKPNKKPKPQGKKTMNCDNDSDSDFSLESWETKHQVTIDRVELQKWFSWDRDNAVEELRIKHCEDKITVLKSKRERFTKEIKLHRDYVSRKTSQINEAKEEMSRIRGSSTRARSKRTRQQYELKKLVDDHKEYQGSLDGYLEDRGDLVKLIRREQRRVAKHWQELEKKWEKHPRREIPVKKNKAGKGRRN